MGDPADQTIEILWVTSAACRTDSSLAATHETKCYTIQAYKQEGVKAKMIDLSNLIQTSGYEVAHPETKDAKFLIGVCRPIQSGAYPQCNGSMACLIRAAPIFDLDGASLPIKLASIDISETSLKIESDFPTIRYTGEEPSGCDSNRTVKVIYQCPTGSEVRGADKTNVCRYIVSV